MKKLFFLVALCCSALVNAQMYLSDGALIQIGDSYMEENIIHAGDVPGLNIGTMTYDPENHILTLTNVEIVTSSDEAALALSCANMAEGSTIEIRVVGQSNFVQNKKSTRTGMSLNDGKFIITGLNATLKLMSNDGTAFNVGCSELTVKDGIYLHAGYSEDGCKTSIGTTASGNPVVTLKCATWNSYGADASMMRINPALDMVEQQDGYSYNSISEYWTEDGTTLLKDKPLVFTPTKNIFWWINANPEGGTITVIKDGNPVSSPYYYGTDEENDWVDILATPNEGWEFDAWRTYNGAVETSAPSTKYGFPVLAYTKSGMLIGYFRYKEPEAPTKPWYVLNNFDDRVLEFTDLTQEPVKVVDGIPDKTEITKSVFAEGRLYYLDQVTSTEVAFFSAAFNPVEGTISDRIAVFAAQNKYQEFYALTYSIADHCFYATAKKTDEKQYLLKIALTGDINEIGEIKGANTNWSAGIYLMAANSDGKLYGVYKSGETRNYENSPYRHGSMFCKIDRTTAAVTPIGWTGYYFESLSCAMSFDYKTDALIATTWANTMSSLISIDVKTGRGRRLNEWTQYNNGIFQMLLQTKKVQVGAKSGDEDKGTAVILETGLAEGIYMVGEEVDIEAFPKTEEYRFVQWSDGNTDNPRTVVLDESSPEIYTAEFALKEGVVAYPIWINDKKRQLTSLSGVLTNANCSAISSGSIAFDPETGTLTLDGLTVESDGDALTIGDNTADALKLTVNMINTSDLTSYGTSIVSVRNADVTFCGEGTIQTHSYYYSSAFVLDQAHVTFDGVEMQIEANEYGIYGTNDAHVVFRGADMTIMGNSSGAIAQLDDLELVYCDITAPVNAAFNPETHQVEDAGGIVKGMNSVVITPYPMVSCMPMEEGTGSFVLKSETEEFTDRGWFPNGTKVTVTAKPASGFEFARWTDDPNWGDDEKKKDWLGKSREIEVSGAVSLMALFYYTPESEETWFAVHDGSFVAFEMNDRAAKVAVASSPDASAVTAGDFRDGDLVYLEGTTLKSVSFGGLDDKKDLPNQKSVKELITAVPASFTDMAYDINDDVLYGVEGTKLYKVKEKEIEELGEFTYDETAYNIVSVAVSFDGKMYVLASGMPGKLFTVKGIDKNTKQVNLVPVGKNGGDIGKSVTTGAQSIAFDFKTDELFWAAPDYLRRFNLSTAKAYICGDLGRMKGMQDVMMAMHCMEALITVSVEIPKECKGMGKVGINSFYDTSVSVLEGTELSLMAEAEDGYEFLYWTIGKSGKKEYTDNPYIITADGETYYAWFEEIDDAVEQTAAPDAAEKLFQNGTLYILKNGRIYNAQGIRLE